MVLKPRNTRATQNIQVHRFSAPMMTTTETTVPMNAPPQNTKVKNDVTPFTTAVGGGEALGYRDVDCCSAWLKICDISEDNKNAETRRYTIEIAYKPATAYCIGSVHAVGTRAGWRPE